jgi:hypothetical protein
VSHSGGLLYHELGGDIDGHERVIRFNGNRVQGFERHVGNRTDVRFGAFPGLLDSEVGDIIVHSVLQPICGQKDCHQKYGRPVRSINGPPVDADPAFGRIMRQLYPNRAGQNETPALELTTGFDGMLLALSNCERVDAFEMTPSDVASKCGGYAYDDEDGLYPGQADENLWHGYFNAEHDLWARLSVDVGLRRKIGKIVLPGFSAVRCEDPPPVLSSAGPPWRAGCWQWAGGFARSWPRLVTARLPRCRRRRPPVSCPLSPCSLFFPPQRGGA